MDSGFSGDMIFLAFLVLLLFGPRKLPEIVKVVGRVAVEFKRAANEFRGQFSREIAELEPLQPAKALVRWRTISQTTLKVRRDGERRSAETFRFCSVVLGNLADHIRLRCRRPTVPGLPSDSSSKR